MSYWSNGAPSEFWLDAEAGGGRGGEGLSRGVMM